MTYYTIIGRWPDGVPLAEPFRYEDLNLATQSCAFLNSKGCTLKVETHTEETDDED